MAVIIAITHWCIDYLIIEFHWDAITILHCHYWYYIIDDIVFDINSYWLIADIDDGWYWLPLLIRFFDYWYLLLLTLYCWYYCWYWWHVIDMMMLILLYWLLLILLLLLILDLLLIIDITAIIDIAYYYWYFHYYYIIGHWWIVSDDIDDGHWLSLLIHYWYLYLIHYWYISLLTADIYCHTHYWPFLFSIIDVITPWYFGWQMSLLPLIESFLRYTLLSHTAID